MRGARGVGATIIALLFVASPASASCDATDRYARVSTFSWAPPGVGAARYGLADRETQSHLVRACIYLQLSAGIH